MSNILREKSGDTDNLSTKRCTSSSSTSKPNKSETAVESESVNLLNGSWFDTVESDTQAATSNTPAVPPKMEIEPIECAHPAIKIENFDGDSVFEARSIKLNPKPEPDNDSANREIAVEFLDVSNEAKYDRLVKDEKIKTPFKRRLSGNSNESRSSSPNSMQSTEEIKPRKPSIQPSKSVPKKTRYDLKNRRESNSSGGDSVEQETCEEILARRQKQIDYGKNTIGYDKYTSAVEKKDRTKDHPWTPPKRTKYSRRAWDGLVKVWRKKLHCWDPASTTENQAADEDADPANSDEKMIV